MVVGVRFQKKFGGDELQNRSSQKWWWGGLKVVVGGVRFWGQIPGLRVKHKDFKGKVPSATRVGLRGIPQNRI